MVTASPTELRARARCSTRFRRGRLQDARGIARRVRPP